VSVSRRGYRVEGRVQGVGFRWWTRKTATQLGVEGFVRNLDDGAVEVQARGAGGALDTLEASLHKGPPMARVERVMAIDPVAPAPADEGTGFQVERGTSG